MVDVDRLRSDLLTARKQRDDVAVTAIRRAITAIENAAAPPPQAGVTEVPRLELSEEQRRGALQAEVDEALAAAAQYDEHGETDRAVLLRAEAAYIQRLLGEGV
jgi:uncharacterized protein YqeY